MAETTKAPRPWPSTLRLLSLPIYAVNIASGVLWGGFGGGLFAGLMIGFAISTVVDALLEKRPR